MTQPGKAGTAGGHRGLLDRSCGRKRGGWVAGMLEKVKKRSNIHEEYVRLARILLEYIEFSKMLHIDSALCFPIGLNDKSLDLETVA